MKTVASLAFLLSIFLLVTGAASAFACAIDLCYSICANCEGHVGDCTSASYWHVCADNTANGAQGHVTSCSGYLFGKLNLDMFSDDFEFKGTDAWLAYGDVSGVPEAWFIELVQRGRSSTLAGVGAWISSPDVQCIVTGKKVDNFHCAHCP